ncbi:MAG TPA: GNAT family N-acetyltransferase, partial [Pyrinomonadaceae bacterium]|nr:GNAT family N-acetyltransferase [Pyrinomonadaceae bacterium]
LDLLNQPSFIRYIGDRKVRSVEQSREYIESRFTESYKNFGFGMWAVELKETGELTGICGFVKRDGLPDADIGFALLPQYEKKGFGFESASAVMRYAEEILKLPRVLDITSKNNESSCKLLGKLNFKFERLIKLPNDDEELKLFSSDQL